MRLTARIVGIALQCALLTMSLVVSGYACGSGSGAAPMAMNGGSMPDLASGVPASPTGGANRSPAPATPTSHPDCSLPWAPGCHSVGPCSSAAARVTAYAYDTGLPQPGVRRHFDGDRLRSVARSPEPPPPRA